MSKYLVLILSLISINMGIQAQTLKDSLLEDIATYSPTSYNLLMSHNDLESSYSYSKGGSRISTQQNTDTYEFMSWNNYNTALNSMSTNLHETCHSYNHFIPYWKMEECECGIVDLDVIHKGYFISTEENLWIQMDEKLLFPSRELIPHIPESKRTFRYKTYIVGEQSAQGHGVLGLLNEFNAYYIGAKYGYDMLPVYEREDPDWGYVWWSNKMKSLMAAYFEFDFYIKEYLLYAMKYRQDTYDYLKNDLSFLNIYGTIQNRYRALLSSYENQYHRNLNKNNKNTDGIRMIMNENPYSTEYEVLKNALSSERYKSIQEDFGVN